MVLKYGHVYYIERKPIGDKLSGFRFIGRFVGTGAATASAPATATADPMTTITDLQEHR